MVQITIYELADETPLGKDESDDERFRHHVIEWLSRRLDEALSFLNQYVVILAGLRDEWHISSLSRIGLPRDAPWKFTLYPTPVDWTDPSGTLDVHATIRDDLPEHRTEEEIKYAIESCTRLVLAKYRSSNLSSYTKRQSTTLVRAGTTSQ